jgi:hypothetical protein
MKLLEMQWDIKVVYTLERPGCEAAQPSVVLALLATKTAPVPTRQSANMIPALWGDWCAARFSWEVLDEATGPLYENVAYVNASAPDRAEMLVAALRGSYTPPKGCQVLFRSDEEASDVGTRTYFTVTYLCEETVPQNSWLDAMGLLTFRVDMRQEARISQEVL